MKDSFGRKTQPQPQPQPQPTATPPTTIKSKEAKQEKGQHQSQYELVTAFSFQFNPLSGLQAFFSFSFTSKFSSLTPTQSTHIPNRKSPMERHNHRYGFIFILCIILSLGLVSFISCLIAETKKAKRKDIKVDGKLCSLPQSHAYEFGVAALVGLCVAKIVGNLLICKILFCSREKTNNWRTQEPRIVVALVVLSWISFGLAVILMSASTSMSKRQPYGEGWLDRECYLVKDGVFIGSGGLVLASLGAITAAAMMCKTKTQDEQGRKVHAQI